jgi:hypothetical protein
MSNDNRIARLVIREFEGNKCLLELFEEDNEVRLPGQHIIGWFQNVGKTVTIGENQFRIRHILAIILIKIALNKKVYSLFSGRSEIVIRRVGRISSE